MSWFNARGGARAALAVVVMLLASTGILPVPGLLAHAAQALPPFQPISTDGSGNPGGGTSNGSTTPDASRVAFVSQNALDAGFPAETGAPNRVFVHDRALNRTIQVSPADTGTVTGDRNDYRPNISADGRWVCFDSPRQLVAGDNTTPGTHDVYVVDLLNAFTAGASAPILISVRDAAGSANQTIGCSLSGDGRLVGYMSEGSDLATTTPLPPDGGATNNAFVADRDSDGNGVFDDTTPSVTSLSVDTAGTAESNGFTGVVQLSRDGRFALIESTATNIGGGGTGNEMEMYVRDRVSGVTQRVSVANGGGPLNAGIDGFVTNAPAMSDDGRFVVYSTPATNVGTATPASDSVYVFDREAGTTTRLSRTATGSDVAGTSDGPTISADGRFVAFRADAALDSSDTNGTVDTYLADRVGGQISRVTDADPGGGSYAWPDAVSAGGRFVVFETDDNIPSLDDNNGTEDVYIADRGTTGTALTITDAGSSAQPLQSLPVSDILAAGDDSPDQLPSAPLRGVDIANTPLRGVDLGSTPLRGVTLSDLPLRGVGSMSTVTLDQIPFARAGGWPAFLAGTQYAGVPPQDVTLEQVLDLLANPPAGWTEGAPQLRELGLDSSPLRGVSLAGLALGGTPLRGVPLEANWLNDSDARKLSLWCQYLTAAGGSCAGISLDQSVLSIELGGGSLLAVPLRGVPLRGVDLTDSPLRGVELRDLHWESTPLRGVPLRGVLLDSPPLRGVALNQIDPQFLALTIDCAALGQPGCAFPPSSPLTFADALDAGAVLANATLGDLFGNAQVPQDSPYQFGDVTLGDIQAALPDGYTLGDLLLAMLDTGDSPLETIPPSQLVKADSSSASGDLALRATVTVDGGTTTQSDWHLDLQLPSGFSMVDATSAAYVSVSASPLHPFVEDDGTICFTDPVSSSDACHGGTHTGTIPAGALVTVDVHLRPLQPGTGGTVTLDFTSHQTPTLTASTGVTVNEASEPANNTPGGATPLSNTNELYLGYIPVATDIDYWKIPVPPAGTRVSVTLESPTDNDLVMYRATTSCPSGAALGGLVPAPQGPASSAIDDSAIGLGNSPTPVAVQHDVPLVPSSTGLPVVDVSAGSTGDESVVTTALGGQGSCPYYFIQVSGYNGTTSEVPYVLRLRESVPASGQSCPGARSFGNADTTGTLTMPASVAPGTNTLFLVPEHRLDRRFGAGPTASLVAKVQQVANDSADGVIGAVVPLDATGSDGTADTQQFSSAAATLDTNPCNIAATNAVVGDAIKTVQDQLAAWGGNATGVKNIVIVGGDEILPFARVPDDTTTANEDGYTEDLVTNSGAFTPEASAAFSSMLLTDDPYGTTNPKPWLDHYVYVPNYSVGRLVESPTDITNQLDQFLTTHGQLDPTTGSVAAGYDFLDDGTQAVDSAIGPYVNPAKRSVLLDTWSRSTLQSTLQSVDPRFGSLNAHFDHYALLPGDKGTLFTLADLPSVTGAVLFSMGCHSGLSVSDSDVDISHPTDWPQTAAQDGAAVWVGNTGYGYGDSSSVALSERLMALFAQDLAGPSHNFAAYTVGSALTRAKQDYFADMGAYGSHDEKALQESTFYGLPMYRLAPTVTTPTDPTVAPTGADHGLLSLAVRHKQGALTYATTTTSNGTQFLTANAEAPQVTEYSPIEPRVADDATVTGISAHGSVLEAASFTDTTGWHAAYARPTNDDADHQPPVVTDGSFPSAFTTVSTTVGNQGPRQQLVTITGQFIANPSTPGVGTQRRFSSYAARVYYSGDSDFTPPTITTIDAAPNPTGVSFVVDAADASKIARVLVLVDDNRGSFVPVDLKPSGGHWVGGLTTSASRVRYLVQVVDRAGNVSVSTGKARYQRSTAHAAAPPSIDVSVSGEPDTVAIGDPVTATVSATDTGEDAYTFTTQWGTNGADGTDVASTTTPSTTLDHVFTQAGTYFVSVNACDDIGECGSTLVVVSVVGEREPIASIGDSAELEPTKGGRTSLFPVTLSQPAAKPVKLVFETVDGTATAGIDYVGVAREGRPSVTIPAGKVETFIGITVLPDRHVEPDETYGVELLSTTLGTIGRGTATGTILDAGKSSTPPRLGIGSASVVNGSSGNRTVTVQVNLAAPTTGIVTMTVATTDGSAIAGRDYKAFVKHVQIPKGADSVSIKLTIFPDVTADDTRQLSLAVSSLVGPAVLLIPNGTITIVNST